MGLVFVAGSGTRRVPVAGEVKDIVVLLFQPGEKPPKPNILRFLEQNSRTCSGQGCCRRPLLSD